MVTTDGGTSARAPRSSAATRALSLIALPTTWMTVFYLIPLVILLAHAFWSVDYLTIDKTFTLDNFREIRENDLYRTVFVRTVSIATIVTVIDIMLALPLCYYLAKHVRRHRELLLILVVFPLWSSYLVRAFAWRTILGTNGIMNNFLEWTGIVDQPLSVLLFSKQAMVLTYVQVWLPFMIIPVFTVIDHIPDSYLEAAADLGSGGLTAFWRIVLPLALPGIVAGSLTVFSLTMGDYITPTLIGGPGDQMIGRIIADNFGTAFNWPLGAALIIPVLLLIFSLMWLANRLGGLGETTR
ncbi:MAG: ABC transporter permease [Thermomicrobiales bacterium]